MKAAASTAATGTSSHHGRPGFAPASRSARALDGDGAVVDVGYDVESWPATAAGVGVAAVEGIGVAVPVEVTAVPVAVGTNLTVPLLGVGVGSGGADVGAVDVGVGPVSETGTP